MGQNVSCFGCVEKIVYQPIKNHPPMKDLIFVNNKYGREWRPGIVTYDARQRNIS